MAEAQLDEGIGHLQAFAADLGAKHADLGAVGDRLGHLHTTGEALTGSLDSTRDRVAQLGEDRRQQLDGALADVDGSVGALLGEGQETGHTLTDVVGGAIDQHQERIAAKADEHTARLEATAQQLHEQGFGAADQSVQAADARLQDQRGKADATHEGFTAKVDETTTTVHNAAESTNTAIGDASEQTQGNLLELMTTGFGSFNDVTDQLMGQDGLLGAFGGFGTDVEAGFGGLGDYMNNIGDQCIEQVDTMISDTIQTVEDEVTKRIQESFEKVVVGAVEGLITDFADSIGLMSAGSAVTAAVSPFVPQLAAAKAVVTTIDDLLDALMLG